MRIPIGLELYSVRDDLARDAFGTLKAVAAMGYEGVEFAGGVPHSGKFMRAILDEVGLVCCGWHTPFEWVQDNKLADTIALNKAVGNTRLIVPGLPIEGSDVLGEWRKKAKFFNNLADKLASHNMVTGYHNHTSEFEVIDGKTPWDVFFSETEGRVVMQLDTGNARHGGANSCDILRRFPNRAGSVHLKPYTPGAEDPFKAPIGEDATPWADVFKLCETIGGTEWYVVEYESSAYPPIDAVARCLKGMKAMGK
ncbi:MAG: sugar phosphate isomerase/epimerase [bacterium]